MAVLDPRLLPLLGTLANTGVDWLAFEIVEMVRRGREPLEAEDVLRATREKVRSQVQSEHVNLDIPVMPEPILGDEQIDWAANYVAARLDEALANLEAGYSLLNAITKDSRDKSRQSSSALPKETSGAPLTLFLNGQEGNAIDRYSISMAKTQIANLREALAHWAVEAKG